MSKLFNLREWLTIDETAQYLTDALDESVYPKDVYRLVQEGHLGLSVNFVNETDAVRGEIVGVDEVEWGEVPSDFSHEITIEDSDVLEKPLRWMRSVQLDENRFFNKTDKVEPINGIYDLMMLGPEKQILEQLCQDLVNGATVKISNLNGSFVTGRRDFRTHGKFLSS